VIAPAARFRFPGAGRLVFAGIAVEVASARVMSLLRAKGSGMRLPIHGRSGLRAPFRLTLAALMLAAALPGTAAVAQYGGGYGGPPPGYDDPAEEGGYRRAPRRREGQPVGFNCDAIQQGLTGP